LKESARQLENQMGTRPSTFCYPHGRHDDRTARATAQAGYSNAVTTELKYLGSNHDPLRLPRLDAYYFRDSGAIEGWGTARFRRYLRLRGIGRSIRSFFTRGGVG
jgi:hypothetical protein